MNNPEIVAPRQEAHQPISLAKLWYSVAVGPIGWTLALLADYFLTPAACGMHSNLILYLIIAAFAIAQMVGILFAVQNMRAAQQMRSARRTVVLDRAFFMACAGLIASSYFLTITLLMFIPVIGLSPCGNSILEGTPAALFQR